MSITVTNIATSSGIGVTSRSITLTNIVAGSTLICAVSRWLNSTSTFVVDDPIHGVWSLGADSIGVGASVLNRYSAIWYLLNSQAAASLTVTVTSSASTEFRMSCAELLGGGLLGGISTWEDNGANVTAYSAAATGFNPTDKSVSIGVITPSSSFGTGGSFHASYSGISLTQGVRPYQISGYRVADADLINERMTLIPSVGRSHVGVSAYFLPAVNTIHQYSPIIGGGIINGCFF